LPSRRISFGGRLAPQVVAVQFDQVEGAQKYAVVSAMVTNEIE
jgi:hypothetical protein